MDTFGTAIITHSNDNESYKLVINTAKKWIIAIASPDVLGDDIPGFSVAEMRAWSVDLDVIERYKATSPVVFNEYKAIQKCATRYNIPTDGVKVFIHSNPSEIFQFLSEHTELEEIPLDGPSTLATHVMVYDTWRHDTLIGYKSWFDVEYPRFEETIAVLKESLHPFTPRLREDTKEEGTSTSFGSTTLDSPPETPRISSSSIQCHHHNNNDSTFDSTLSTCGSSQETEEEGDDNNNNNGQHTTMIRGNRNPEEEDEVIDGHLPPTLTRTPSVSEE